MAQTRVLRACCRYLLQTGIPFSQAYMERVLHAHSHITRDLWRLFERRLNPEATDRRAVREAADIERRVHHAISEVRNPDDDRILRGFLAVIRATARTNHFCNHHPGQPLAFKLNPGLIPGLPQPRPAYEIFVHGTHVEGVHMRSGRHCPRRHPLVRATGRFPHRGVSA